MRVLVYQAHPALHFSKANTVMNEAGAAIKDITFWDLYAQYPRFSIDVSVEQQLLLDHDVIVFQCPFFWYSTPSIIKEWQDLVLEHGFAYGHGGDRLTGKRWAMGLTCGGPQMAYAHQGHNHYPLRTFLTPLEQTARLCGMRFIAPYVLYYALKAPSHGLTQPHATGWRRYLEALRDDSLDLDAADQLGVLQATNLDEVLR